MGSRRVHVVLLCKGRGEVAVLPDIRNILKKEKNSHLHGILKNGEEILNF